MHYNLSCHTHELGAGVAEAFERALGLFSRPVDPANPGGPHQVWSAHRARMLAPYRTHPPSAGASWVLRSGCGSADMEIVQHPKAVMWRMFSRRGPFS